MTKKYAFTGVTKETTVYDGCYPRETKVMHQIIATKDFGSIKTGTVGGWVESENNLSQEGDCWITEWVNVYDNAIVSENAYIDGDVIIDNNAIISGNAKIDGSLSVNIHDNVVISGNAYVHGHVYLYGNSKVCGKAEIDGKNIYIYGNAWIGHHAKISENAIICNSATIYGHAHIHGQAHINGNAEIFGHANIEGHAKIFGDNYEIDTDKPLKATKWDVYPRIECEFYPIETKDEYENTNAKLRKEKTRISGNVQITGYALIGNGVTLNNNEHLNNGFYNGTNEPREDVCGVCYVEETRNWKVYLVPSPVLDEDKYYVA